MSYVNYTVGSGMQMGPPSLGATPRLRSELPPSVRYTQGMTTAQRATFNDCMREKRKLGHLKAADWAACRADVLAGRAGKAKTPAASSATTASSTAGESLLSDWRVWAAGGAAVVVFLWMRR